MEAAFEKADVILDHYFETPMVDHAYIEPDVCIAEPDLIQGGITIYSPQHNVQGAKKSLCKVFGLPQSKIHVISTTGRSIPYYWKETCGISASSVSRG